MEEKKCENQQDDLRKSNEQLKKTKQTDIELE